MRIFIPISEIPHDFESRLCRWAAARPVSSILQSNRVENAVDPYSSFETCVAVDAVDEIRNASPAFDALKDFHGRHHDWLFGFFSYDLKNETENLFSANRDRLDFPLIYFFRPRFIFIRKNSRWKIGYLDDTDTLQSVQHAIAEITAYDAEPETENDFDVLPLVLKNEYLKNVAAIKLHIQRGDIYEMNYCMEFYANADLNGRGAYDLYEKLQSVSPMPFSCYYKVNAHHLMCASPERFLARRGNKIISQPIKGTVRRGATKHEDERLKAALAIDAKERSENVMIVDLVRNDLSRTAQRKSVKVEELYGVYTFRQLHQMISTVVSEINNEVHWTDVIRHAFPMGSMTGAPKVRAMQLIEEFEQTKRGLYSGAAGYVTPEGDFDFNVVIRSLQYNSDEKYLSFMAGSAITANADAQKEYDECMLKAASMRGVLDDNNVEHVS